MLAIKLSKQFKKDLQRDKKSGRYTKEDFEMLKNVMEILIDNKKLDEKYLPHKLSGDYKDYDECHLKPNWILIYQQTQTTISFARIGTHQQLFKKY